MPLVVVQTVRLDRYGTPYIVNEWLDGSPCVVHDGLISPCGRGVAIAQKQVTYGMDLHLFSSANV